MNESQTNRYYKVSEAAEILELSTATVRRLFDSGELKGFRIPGGDHRRISVASVRDFQRNSQLSPDRVDEVAP